jgi:hypothetical protein
MRLNFGDPIIPVKSFSSWFPLFSAISAAAVCPFLPEISNGLGGLACQIRGNQSGKRCQHLQCIWPMNDYEELRQCSKQSETCAFIYYHRLNDTATHPAPLTGVLPKTSPSDTPSTRASPVCRTIVRAGSAHSADEQDFRPKELQSCIRCQSIVPSIRHQTHVFVLCCTY